MFEIGGEGGGGGGLFFGVMHTCICLLLLFYMCKAQ